MIFLPRKRTLYLGPRRTIADREGASDAYQATWHAGLPQVDVTRGSAIVAISPVSADSSGRTIKATDDSRVTL